MAHMKCGGFLLSQMEFYLVELRVCAEEADSDQGFAVENVLTPGND